MADYDRISECVADYDRVSDCVVDYDRVSGSVADYDRISDSVVDYDRVSDSVVDLGKLSKLRLVMFCTSLAGQLPPPPVHFRLVLAGACKSESSFSTQVT